MFRVQSLQYLSRGDVILFSLLGQNRKSRARKYLSRLCSDKTNITHSFFCSPIYKVFSNLPGPDKSIELWGKKLIETMFWLPNVGHSGENKIAYLCTYINLNLIYAY